MLELVVIGCFAFVVFVGVYVSYKYIKSLNENN